MTRPHHVALTAAAALAVAVASAAAPALAQNRSVHYTTQVLRVGTWHGIKGNEPTIDAAMAALRPGGWLLIGPGDWHPQMDHQPDQAGADFPSAVDVTVPNVHIRGMNRNTTIIDGTKPGSAPCSSKPQDQDFGALVKGAPQGRNGPTANKVSGVWFENFTACNFLTGSADSGNEIWWNGGDDGGKIGLHEWWGDYLTASSSYFDAAHSDTAAQYGIFVSNSDGTGTVTHAYASNMNDSSFYIGACRDCNGTLDDVTAENSALGLSSTNAGGHLVIENSEWDQNKTGLVNNSQNSADPPTPQDGSCPNGGTGPYGTTSCTVWRNNYVHDNNNANVPFSGTAGLGPTGTGMVLAGIRDDTVYGNRIENNGAWGLLIVPFPDTSSENEHNVSNCNGGVLGGTLPASIGGQAVPCLFDSFRNHVVNNAFAHNGSFGNATNGDIGDLTEPPAESPGAGGDCYNGNTDAGGLSTSPTLLTSVQTDCSNPTAFPLVYAGAEYAALAAQVSCDTAAFGQCPSNPAVSYPQTTTVVLKPIPHDLPSMPNPCAGVPDNPWCELDERATSTTAKGSHTKGSGTTRATAPTGQLAATGERAWLPVSALALVGAGAAAGIVRRRRRSVLE